MASFDPSKLDQGFDFVLEIASFTGSKDLIESTGLLRWTSDLNVGVAFLGSGFAYSGKVPIAGKVTEFRFDFDNNGVTDVAAKGLSLDLTKLAPLFSNALSTDQQNNLVWASVLGGSDKVTLGTKATSAGFLIKLAGDGRFVAEDQKVQGGNDKIAGDVGGIGANFDAGGIISGDFFNVEEGGKLYGGDDEIAVTGKADASLALGDGRVVDGFVRGGGDSLSVQLGGTLFQMIGDVLYLSKEGVAVGGDDTLSGNAAELIGDAAFVFGDLIGGGDTITGSDGANTLYGDAVTVMSDGAVEGGADTLLGAGGADTLYGDWKELDPKALVKGGADMLDGGAGADKLYGNAGDDRLDGGTGNDRLGGGAGKDAFLFSTGLDAAKNLDRVIDFSVADDALELEDKVFSKLKPGQLDPGAFKDLGVVGAKLDAGDRILYNRKTGDLSYDPDGSGKAAAVLFAHLGQQAGRFPTLTAADFLVV